MEKLKQHKFLLPVTILLLSILNIIQGSYTELLPDEAYYWVYSQDMNWGFFDHLLLLLFGLLSVIFYLRMNSVFDFFLLYRLA